MWNPIERIPSAAPENLSVDVFITTYNEDLGLLRKTALCCINMSYPHKTYILDDGNRPECRELARELNCHYISRASRADAKAGNLNHALRETGGDFIATFDADCIPQEGFLEKTLGYFGNDRVAFVQVPQHSYNTDSFLFKIDRQRKKEWNEQNVFYRLIMPGRDYWNSAYFVGSGAVFRRTALEDVGGFATGTITEDLHTSLRLYKKGWRSIYHNELLVSGLATKDLKNYYVQKLRWGEGNISLLFHENPLFAPGLTLAQRISFFAVIFGWLIGFPKLIYFTTPAVLLLFGVYPIANFDLNFIILYLFSLTTIMLGFKLVSRGYGTIINDEQYNMLNFFVLIKASVRAFFKRSTTFQVSGKGQPEEIAFSLILPQVALVFVNAVAVIWGLLKLSYGVSNDFLGLGIAAFWACVNAVLAFSIVRKILIIKYERGTYRVMDALPVTFAVPENRFRLRNVRKMQRIEDNISVEFHAQHQGRTGLGITLDITEEGLALLTFQQLPLHETINLVLQLGRTTIACEATALYLDRQYEDVPGAYKYGIRFQNIGQQQRDSITQYCFNVSLPRFFRQFENKQSFLMRTVARLHERHTFRQRDPRFEFRLPIIISSSLPIYCYDIDVLGVYQNEIVKIRTTEAYPLAQAGGSNAARAVSAGSVYDSLHFESVPYGFATTTDISLSGVSFISAERFSEGSTLYIALISPRGLILGDVSVRRVTRIFGHELFQYGSTFGNLTFIYKERLQMLVSKRLQP